MIRRYQMIEINKDWLLTEGEISEVGKNGMRNIALIPTKKSWRN